MGVDKATASGRAAVEQMKAMPTDDPLFGKGKVRMTAGSSTTCTCSR